MSEDDYPYDEIVKSAEEVVASGATVYFKFTCQHCGSRQTFDTPNAIYEEGSCEECGGWTNVREHGGNFTVVVAPPDALAMLERRMKQ